MTNFYDILRVPQDATPEEIKQSYRALLKEFHPDIYPGDKDFAQQATQQIIEAYSTLGDEEKRRHYDAFLRLCEQEEARTVAEASPAEPPAEEPPTEEKPAKPFDPTFLIRFLLIIGSLGVPAYFSGYYVLVLLCGITALVRHVLSAIHSRQVTFIMLTIATIAGVTWAKVLGRSVFLGIPLAYCWDSVATLAIGVLSFCGSLPSKIAADGAENAIHSILRIASRVLIIGTVVAAVIICLGAVEGLRIAGTELEEKEAMIEDLYERMEGLSDEVVVLESELKEKDKEIAEYRTKARFLDKHMAISITGEIYSAYHTLDCPLLKDHSRIYFCLVRDANASGGWPCPQCH